MGIFSGIEILFYFLGVITTLLFLALIRLANKYYLQWYSWILAVSGISLSVFTIAWSVSSTLEGEPQSASMGLLLFGFPVLCIFGIFRRLVKKTGAVD